MDVLRTCFYASLVCLGLLLSGSAAYVTDSQDISDEKKLIKVILENYEKASKHGRPVRNISHPVQVKFGLGLIQMELDEKDKALWVSIWSKFVWVDEYLTWDPVEHSNISQVKLEVELLWIPDVMLYNTAETEIHRRASLATVFNNGTVLWVPHQNLKSSCSIAVTNFPFDTQHCHMWFGSWTYVTEDLNLSMAFPGGIDLSTYTTDFKDSSQWEIVDMVAQRQVLPSTEEDPNYAVLTYTLVLKRNLVFASYILTLPCVFLACLTLVVFWLPPDRPDRTSLAMSIFSSFLLLLLILVEAAPPTASSVPLLGIYYCFNMVIIMLAIFLSSLVVNVCRMGEGNKPVPAWLRRISLEGPLRFLTICSHVCPSDLLLEDAFWAGASTTEVCTDTYKGRSVNMSYPPLLPCHTPWQKNNKNSRTHFANSGGKNSQYYQQTKSTNSRQRQAINQNGSNMDSRDDSLNDPAYETFSSGHVACHITVLKQSLLRIEEHVNHRAQRQCAAWRLRKEWMCIAVILDRLFFLTYVILIVVSIATLFPRP